MLKDCESAKYLFEKTSISQREALIIMIINIFYILAMLIYSKGDNTPYKKNGVKNANQINVYWNINVLYGDIRD